MTIDDFLTQSCGAVAITDAVFSSPGYPATDNADRSCLLTVKPPPGICGIR